MKQFFILLISCCFFSSAYGQYSDATVDPDQNSYAAGSVFAGITYAQPLGSFRQAYPRADAVGGMAGILINPKLGPSPLELGVQGGYLSQGRTLNMTQPGTFFNTLKTAHSIIPVHLVARVKPMHRLHFKPYIDALAGMTVFNARSKVKEDIFDFLRDEHQAVVLSKHSTYVMSYGIGAGVLFNGGRSKDFFADLRVVYLQSPFADYVPRNQVRVQQDGYPLYLFTRSETSMLLVQLNINGIIRR